jgi:hypothetical protein
MLTCTQHNKHFFDLHFDAYILACPEMGQIAASRLRAKARRQASNQTTNNKSHISRFYTAFCIPESNKPKLIANRSILLSIFEYPCGSVIVRIATTFGDNGVQNINDRKYSNMVSDNHNILIS